MGLLAECHGYGLMVGTDAQGAGGRVREKDPKKKKKTKCARSYHYYMRNLAIPGEKIEIA